jgi:hypothetical protein
MKLAASRITTITAAVVLGAATLGCGVLSQAKQAVDNLSTVADLVDRLGKASQLTFTAEYKLDDKTTATVVQQPPNFAVLGKDGRYIFTQDAIYLCDKKTKPATCQKSPNNVDAKLDESSSAYQWAVAGPSFVSAPFVVVMMTAASIAPGVKVDKSERKIAGLQSTCLKITGIPADTDPNTPDLKDFSACVSDNGLLTSFSGTESAGGRNLAVEMTSYKESADPAAFKPPAGYKVVETDQIQTR